MDINYTIIIPHKNIPSLLKRCLHSIPQRKDLEVIVVDDKSDPDKVDFESFPGLDRDDVTVIFDKSGKGAGHARNIGLENARGKKLLFADADDFFNYCLNDILDEYKDDTSDIVFFNASGINCEYYYNEPIVEHVNRYIQCALDKNDFIHLRYDLGSPWCKLINRSVVLNNGIAFQETSIHNDTKFSYLIGFYSKRFKADKHAIYCYTKRNDSITGTLLESKFRVRISIFAERQKFFENNAIECSERSALTYMLADSMESNKDLQVKLILNELDKFHLDSKKCLDDARLIVKYRHKMAFRSKVKSLVKKIFGIL